MLHLIAIAGWFQSCWGKWLAPSLIPKKRGLQQGLPGCLLSLVCPLSVLYEAWQKWARSVHRNCMQKTINLSSTQLQMWHQLFIRVILPPINSQALWTSLIFSSYPCKSAVLHPGTLQLDGSVWRYPYLENHPLQCPYIGYSDHCRSLVLCIHLCRELHSRHVWSPVSSDGFCSLRHFFRKEKNNYVRYQCTYYRWERSCLLQVLPNSQSASLIQYAAPLRP